jgi:hypothetical protein
MHVSFFVSVVVVTYMYLSILLPREGASVC